MGNQQPQPKSDGQQIGKKAYRKPGLQVYGTLSQMTGATPSIPATRTDNPGAQPNPPNNRT